MTIWNGIIATEKKKKVIGIYTETTPYVLNSRVRVLFSEEQYRKLLVCIYRHHKTRRKEPAKTD